jgi:hypothetical protein
MTRSHRYLTYSFVNRITQKVAAAIETRAPSWKWPLPPIPPILDLCPFQLEPWLYGGDEGVREGLVRRCLKALKPWIIWALPAVHTGSTDGRAAGCPETKVVGHEGRQPSLLSVCSLSVCYTTTCRRCCSETGFTVSNWSLCHSWTDWKPKRRFGCLLCILLDVGLAFVVATELLHIT